jgi:PAS domain S-box-containing protein
MYSKYKDIAETPIKLFSYLNSLTIALLVAFTSLMALSLLLNIHDERLQALAHAELKARAIMDKDLEYRLWPMNHGGVYVPVTEQTRPNPHLKHVPDRDILTVSGQHLTLINTTIRNQGMHLFEELSGGQGHVTSLKLLNKQNAPDNWERRALLEFNNGVKEKFEVVGTDNSQKLRLMKPLITYEGCLKCHGIQNIKVGDIRGGIGVSVPVGPHLVIEKSNIRTVAISHMFIWFLGLTGIGTAYGKGRSVILDRVAAEKTLMEVTVALAESEEKYRIILNSTGEGIFGIDLNGNCTFANPACVRLLGYDSADELLGRNMHQLSHHTHTDGTPYPDKECKIYQSLHNIEAAHRDEEIFWRANNTSFPVEYCSYPQLNKHEIIGAVISFMDISLRKEQERQKAALHEQLIQSQKMEAIGQFAGGIAHDFNNILTVIHGFGTMLKGGLSENDPLGAEVDHILTAADRAAQLTRSLLLFSRKQLAEPKPVDLNQIIHGMEKFLFRVIKEDISLRTELWTEKLIVHADIGQIEQVLMNLASNARDAMPGGGTLIIKTEAMNIDEQFIWRHGFGKLGDYALISVTDSGVGMDDDICQKIFEPFFTTKEAGKGTGLGLAMVYGIVTQHQGYIDVTSLPGQGATFDIYLPIIEYKLNEEQQATHVNYIEGGNETILVAEDDAATRELLVTTLNSYGYTVFEARDGNDAVNIFKEHPDTIQLLLLDITMPNKSGSAAYEEVIRMRPNIRAIFMTGYPVDMYKNDKFKYEGCTLLMKPIFVVELIRKIRELLN